MHAVPPAIIMYFTHRNGTMAAAMGTPGFHTCQRWASTSTARLPRSLTRAARISSPLTFLHHTSRFHTPNPAIPFPTWETRFPSILSTNRVHQCLISSKDGPADRTKTTRGLDAPVWPARYSDWSRAPSAAEERHSAGRNFYCPTVTRSIRGSSERAWDCMTLGKAWTTCRCVLGTTYYDLLEVYLTFSINGLLIL